MSTVIPLGRHWRGPTLVDLSKVLNPLSKPELLAACLRSGVKFSTEAKAGLLDYETDRPDPTSEVVAAYSEMRTERFVPRETIAKHYARLGLTSLSQRLLLEVLSVPGKLSPGHYGVLVGVGQDCFDIVVKRNGPKLQLDVSKISAGMFILNNLTWILQRSIPSKYRG